MTDKNIFVNKVEASGIIALDLLDYRPLLDVIEFDIKELLYMETIVREKEFRALLSDIDPSEYNNKAIAIVCSADTIIPQWTYMALAAHFQDYAAYMDLKNKEHLTIDLWKQNLRTADFSLCKGKKVVVRTRTNIPPELYMAITILLRPIVRSLMYGEIGMPKVIFKT